MADQFTFRLTARNSIVIDSHDPTLGNARILVREQDQITFAVNLLTLMPGVNIRQVVQQIYANASIVINHQQTLDPQPTTHTGDPTYAAINTHTL